ncbi:MAG: alpha/beta fold hydrolase [Chloroflexota bacterium]
MSHNKTLLWLCLLSILAAACQSRTPVPTPDLSLDGQSVAGDLGADFESEVTWTECLFEAYRGQRAQPECGFVTVPLHYAGPNSGETLRLGFVRYKTFSEDPKPDPVLLLAPFPLVSQAGFLPYLFEQLYKERDLLVVDIRGIGVSEPALYCPEMDEAWWASMPAGALSSEQWGELHLACRQKLEAQHVDLDAYSLTAMATDFKVLRTALAYPEWDIIALGEGAYLAYELLAIDPDGVRSLVLDNVVPVYTGQPVSYAAADELLREIFALCTQDDSCREAFPNVEKVFYEVVEQLNAQPITVLARDNQGGRQTDMLVDGNGLIDITLQIARSNDLERIGQIPRMIYQLSIGKTTTLAKLAGLTLEGASMTLQGLYAMANCRHFPLPDDTATHAALATLPPGLSNYFAKTASDQQAICAAWGQAATLAPTTATAGDTPILLLSGEWNWNAPTPLIDLFEKSAPGLRVAAFSASGVNLFFTRGTMQCAQDLFNAFVGDPDAALDMQCTQAERDITWITLP